MVNGKTWRYASRGLNGSVEHIAEQISSAEVELVDKLQSKLVLF